MLRFPKALVLSMSALLPVTQSLVAASLSTGDFTINQLNSGGPTTNGEIYVNNSVGAGFVNVLNATGTQWLVQNLYVGLDPGYTYTNTGFQISGTDTTVSSDNLIVDYSSTPFATSADVYADDSTVDTGLAVTQLTDNEGCPAGDPNGACDPGAPGPVSFNGLGFSADYQLGHPNVEAALNQCAPAAVANSLTYLGLSPEADNNPGRFDVPADGYSTSLVAQLDQLMGRSQNGCTQEDIEGNFPCGVWPLDGKLAWLDANGYTNDQVAVNVQNASDNPVGDAGNGGSIIDGVDYTSHGVTATNQGTPTFDFIQSEIAKGEDVEMDIRYPNGGRHYVEVTGAGTILGVNWITHISDTEQDADGGTDSVQFEWVTGDNQLPLEGDGAIIDQVISESVVPEPGTILLIGAGLFALGWAGKRRRR